MLIRGFGVDTSDAYWLQERVQRAPCDCDLGWVAGNYNSPLFIAVISAMCRCRADDIEQGSSLIPGKVFALVSAVGTLEVPTVRCTARIVDYL